MPLQYQAHRLSVAPMMDWTDRHCRYLHRQLSRRTLLYTEMVVASAITRAPVDYVERRLLGFSPEEHPIALQLGGSDPVELAEATRIACSFGFDEINLNVGCPSDRVQSGTFGACLMREPDLVARCVSAMIEASAASSGPEITVKCRLGVDDQEPSETLPVFVDTVADAGVRSFSIHARKAWLKGLSPKENRDVPPLDYALARQMKARRPDLTMVLNGGLASLAQAREEGAFDPLDGAMFGRAAYHHPTEILSSADRVVFGEPGPDVTAEGAARAMMPYIEAELAKGARLHQITRHMLGLFSGRRGAREWRRRLTEDARAPGTGPELIERCLSAIEDEAA